MVLKGLALTAALALAGCSTLRQITPPTAAVACMAADVATTVIGREAYGKREANPLVGHYGVLIGSKVATFALIYSVNRWVTPVSDWAWWGVAGANCGVAVWNGAQIAR